MVIPADNVRKYLNKPLDMHRHCLLITGKRAIRMLHDVCNWAIDVDRTPELESATYYRQIVPCCTVAMRPGNVKHTLEDERLILMTRTAKQSEARLHNNYYVEVGGHLNEGESVIRGLQRELKEEIGVLIHDYQLFFQGIIVDFTDEVGMCHIGILYHTYVEPWQIGDFRYLAEYEKHKHRWRSLRSIKRQGAKLGTWSKCIVKNYYGQ